MYSVGENQYKLQIEQYRTTLTYQYWIQKWEYKPVRRPHIFQFVRWSEHHYQSQGIRGTIWIFGCVYYASCRSQGMANVNYLAPMAAVVGD